MPLATVSAYLWVAFGGAIGSVCRFGLGLAMLRVTGPRYPWGTLLINVLGSFVIGYFGELSRAGGRLPVSEEIRIFVIVGFCGGFTTFSSFSLQTLDLFRLGLPALAASYIAASVALCLAAVYLGVVLGKL